LARPKSGDARHIAASVADGVCLGEEGRAGVCRAECYELGGAMSHSIQRPKEIDGGRAAGRQAIADFFERGGPGGVRRGGLIETDDDAIRCCDSDRRRSADLEPLDRLTDLLQFGALDRDDLVG
jgi:hypothetical protein